MSVILHLTPVVHVVHSIIEGLSDKLNQEDMHRWNEMRSIVGGIFRVGG